MPVRNFSTTPKSGGRCPVLKKLHLCRNPGCARSAAWPGAPPHVRIAPAPPPGPPLEIQSFPSKSSLSLGLCLGGPKAVPDVRASDSLEARPRGGCATWNAAEVGVFRARTSVPGASGKAPPLSVSRLRKVGRLARGPSSRQDRPLGPPPLPGLPWDSVFFPRKGVIPSPLSQGGRGADPDVRGDLSAGTRPPGPVDNSKRLAVRARKACQK